MHADSTSGSLLHRLCVSTVFWYPQSNHLICEALDSHEMSYVYQVHIFSRLSVWEFIGFKFCIIV